jgi:valyl-tRNA synthetase
LGWPEQTPDFATYYPTSALITAYDILFFWVARMAMMGIHFTGRVPFKTVYLHSLVRTSSGEKMSKSTGTGLDPVALNKQYGTDAMRFCLASMAAPGTDIVLSGDRLESARNFANKIWNAARFLFMNLDKFEQRGVSIEELASPEVRAAAPYKFEGTVPLVDQWLYTRLAITIETVNSALGSYRFHEAAQNVYQFFWGDFCDWYIEWVKPELQSADRERALVAWKNLFAAFDDALRLLHPFMPFLTEELWHQLPQAAGAKSIALDQFPGPRPGWAKDGKEGGTTAQFQMFQEIVAALRNIRAEAKLDPKKRVAAEVYAFNQSTRERIEEGLDGITRLGLLSELKISKAPLEQLGGAVRSTADFDVRIAYSEAVDPQAEKARLIKEREGLQKAIVSKEAQLDNETFRSRAPEKIIKGLEETLATQRIELRKLEDRLGQL